MEEVNPEIEGVKTIDRADLLSKRKREIDHRITLVLTYHPALTKVYEILQKAHRQLLTQVLPSPPRLAFRNAKILIDHLVSSRLKSTYEKPVKFAIYCIKEIHLKVQILVNNIRLTFHLIVTAEC